MMPDSLEPEAVEADPALLQDTREMAMPPTPPTRPPVPAAPLSGLAARNISAWFGDHKVLDRVSLNMDPGTVTALIGPSGCGKSTFLRILNRMHEMIRGAALAGEVLLDDVDIYDAAQRPTDVRRRIGMVFQKPNPFPAMSIYDNVASGLKLAGIKVASRDDIVETQPAPGWAVERGAPAAQGAGRRAVRRPAAAAVHRQGTRGHPRRAPDGRAVLGARPDFDAADRGHHR